MSRYTNRKTSCKSRSSRFEADKFQGVAERTSYRSDSAAEIEVVKSREREPIQGAKTQGINFH